MVYDGSIYVGVLVVVLDGLGLLFFVTITKLTYYFYWVTSFDLLFYPKGSRQKVIQSQSTNTISNHNTNLK